MFHKKKIVTQQTLGEYLRKVRLGAEVSLEEVSQKTRINAKYLRAIEDGAYADISIGEIYLLNFIRAYGAFLGVNIEKIVAQHHAEKHVMEWRLQHRPLGVKRTFSLIDFVMNANFLRFSALTFVLLALLSYFGYQAFLSSAKPDLIISYPTDNLVVTKPRIMVRGETEPEADLKINDQHVLVRETGSFEEEIDLKSGINLIVVTASKKNKHAAKAVLRVLVNENTLHTISFLP